MKDQSAVSWKDTPAGQQVLTTFSEEKTLVALENILKRLDTLERAINHLAIASDRAPGMMAMTTDMADDIFRQAEQKGVDMDERIKNALSLVEKMTSNDTVDQINSLLKLAGELPGLISIGVDVLDDRMETLINKGHDPQKLYHVATAANEALTRAAEEAPAHIGIFGLLRALKDPDRQKSLGFLMSFLKHFGQKF